MIHAGDMSLLDYNRTGTPLLEIVTEPDMELAEEAEVLIQELRRIVRYLGVSDGNMEEGSMRADANVSINLQGQGLGNKVEVKNLNSSRFVRKSLAYEIDRQQEIMDKGGTVVQQTRLWNENRDQTEVMRTKENANDYRYFPEPDLPPFKTDAEFLARVEAVQIELPSAKRERYRNEFGLSDAQAEFVTDERLTAEFFEDCVARGADPVQVVTWLSSDVQKELHRAGLSLSESPLGAERLVSMLSLLAEGRIHGKIAKQVLKVVFEEDKDPEAIISERNWEQITDPAKIRTIVDQVIAGNAKAVEEIAAGDSRPIKFLIGKAMQASSGRAEPRLVQQQLEAALLVRSLDVLSFGGAISGKRRGDGLIEPGNLVDVQKRLSGDGDINSQLRFEEISFGSFLSEELSPGDWARLVFRVAEQISQGSGGIVIAHGTDTLAYTAALLHWLFGDAGIPIVLVAALGTLDDDGQGLDSLKAAIRSAETGNPGVRVQISAETLPAYNLKFRSFEPAQGEQSFATWNAAQLKKIPVDGALLLSRVGELPDAEKLIPVFEDVLSRTALVKIYPGMKSSFITALIDQGVENVILELYDSGTANLRQSPFSIRDALEYGKKAAVSFFCTSQQEGVVDFADYVTSHELWKEGALPMGLDSSETAFARVVARQVIAALTE
jgi:aspartyl-tRNA(Asn)/glutamyl-tRNA(Gln) amidotransferase subunit B